MKFWTILASKSYEAETTRLWIEDRRTRTSLQTLEATLQRSDLDEWLHRTANQRGPHLWIMEHVGCDIMLSFKPLDCQILLIWVRTRNSTDSGSA